MIRHSGENRIRIIHSVVEESESAVQRFIDHSLLGSINRNSRKGKDVLQTKKLMAIVGKLQIEPAMIQSTAFQ